MKAIEQCIHVVLFVNFKSVDKTQLCDHSVQMKAVEQFFHLVLFIMLYKVVLSFKSVDETLM